MLANLAQTVEEETSNFNVINKQTASLIPVPLDTTSLHARCLMCKIRCVWMYYGVMKMSTFVYQNVVGMYAWVKKHPACIANCKCPSCKHKQYIHMRA